MASRPLPVNLTHLLVIFAVGVPLLFSLYYHADDSRYVQTGSGPDPLKQKTPVYATTAGTNLELALSGIKIQDFIEIYCYQPMEITGKKFLVANINLTNRQNSRHNLSLDMFSVVDTANTTHRAHNDTRVYDHVNPPFRMYVSGNGFLNPRERNSGDLIFWLPKNVTPAKLVYQDDTETLVLDLP